MNLFHTNFINLNENDNYMPARVSLDPGITIIELRILCNRDK